MHNTRQINYWTLGGFENKKPVEQAILEVKEMGLDGIELGFDGGQFGRGISESRCKEIRSVAKEAGIAIETLATGIYWNLSLASPRESIRKKAIAFTKEYLQVAQWVGAKTILVIPGAVAVPWDPSQPVVPYQEVWKLATLPLDLFCPLRKKLESISRLKMCGTGFLQTL